MIPFYFQRHDPQRGWVADPNGDYFFAVADTEHAEGGVSAVIQTEWLRWSSRWGSVTFDKIAAMDSHGTHLADADLSLDYWRIPDGARQITIEGRRSVDGSQGPIGMPSARLLPLGK